MLQKKSRYHLNRYEYRHNLSTVMTSVCKRHSAAVDSWPSHVHSLRARVLALGWSIPCAKSPETRSCNPEAVLQR